MTRIAIDYDTGSALGVATERLAVESDKAVGSTYGVVSAYIVDALGRWEYLPEHRCDDFRRMGKVVRAVFVEPA